MRKVFIGVPEGAMDDALVGYTGFVGTTLLTQHRFENLFRSTNITEISNRTFNLMVCAGAPAQKWIANRDPAGDHQNIERLIEHLKTVNCSKMVLISTVDVFRNPIGVNEETSIEEPCLQPYGLHRHMLEKFVAQHFSRHLIVRLAGVIGPGLRKNIIFDFLHDNDIHAIDSRGIFQFYPMVNLWYDIQIALREGLSLLHLTAEPISVAEVVEQGFGRKYDRALSVPPAVYDMQSIHASLFGGQKGYQYSKRETIQAVRAYAQSEPRVSKMDAHVTK